MRKNRALMIIALLLVVVIGAGLFAGCQPRQDDSSVVVIGENPSTNKGKTITLSEADSLITFAISTNKAVGDIKSYVTVTEMANGASVPVTIGQKGGNKYVINPPAGGYDMASSYKVSLVEGANFVAYPDARNIIFTVTSNVMASVKLNAGVFEYSSKHIIGDVESTGVAEDGTDVGNFMFQTNGIIDLKINDIIVISEENTQVKKAYKVSNIISTNNENVVGVEYTKPNVDEVYSEFAFENTTKLDKDSDIDFVFEEDGGNALEKSELANSIVSIFGQKPVFNIAATTLSNGIRATVSITIPDVVKVDGLGNSSITIQIVNDLTCEADTSMLLQEVMAGIKEANFGIATNIKNTTTCSVRIDAYADINKVQNAQDLLEKLHKLANNGQDKPADEITNGEIAGDMDKIADASSDSTGIEASTCIPLFRWALPLAGGAIVIDADTDLVFKFNFSGEFELNAVGSLEYAVGVTYDRENGVKVSTENIKESDKFMDSINIQMAGVATVKVGIIERVGINLLGGVLSAKVCAEVGNYNRLYGYAQTNDLMDEEIDFVGALYFDGGFYYDVNLLLGIKLGPITIQDQNIKITAGEISLYNAGTRELELSLAPKATWTLTALSNTLPEYEVNCYDLVTRARYTKVADPADLVITVDEMAMQDISVVENQLVVNAFTGFEGREISVRYKDFPAVKTSVSFAGAFYLDKSNFSFDKSQERNYIQAVITKSPDVTEEISVMFGDKQLDANFVETSATQTTISISEKELCKLPSQMNTLQIIAGDKSVDMNVDVTGFVAWNRFVISNNSYELLCADQINSLVNSKSTFENVSFAITTDIDMNGAVIAPIADFRGTIFGGDFTISNYTINSMEGKQSGFFAVNNGIIENVTFAGNVSINLDGKYQESYAIGGVAGINNGTISNANFVGTLNVNANAIASGISYNIGAIAGLSNTSALIDCDSTGAVVDVIAKFALANTRYNLGGLTSNASGNATLQFKTTYGVQSMMDVRKV